MIDCSIKTNSLQHLCVPKIALFLHISACRKMSHLQFPKYKLLNKSYVNVKFSEVSKYEKEMNISLYFTLVFHSYLATN